MYPLQRTSDFGALRGTALQGLIEDDEVDGHGELIVELNDEVGGQEVVLQLLHLLLELHRECNQSLQGWQFIVLFVNTFVNTFMSITLRSGVRE